MTLYSMIFYVLAGAIVAATGLAVAQRNLVRAVIYLIFSFFGTAMLFYLFGAPLLAALEVIIYAGAIMVLFLFIIMMTRVESFEEVMFPLTQWLPAGLFGVIYIAVGALLYWRTPDSGAPLKAYLSTPKEFAVALFQRHWLAIEIVSLLLLVALIGALYLGKTKGRDETEDLP